MSPGQGLAGMVPRYLEWSVGDVGRWGKKRRREEPQRKEKLSQDPACLVPLPQVTAQLLWVCRYALSPKASVLVSTMWWSQPRDTYVPWDRKEKPTVCPALLLLGHIRPARVEGQGVGNRSWLCDLGKLLNFSGFNLHVYKVWIIISS